jgi:hypothetical protein
MTRTCAGALLCALGLALAACDERLSDLTGPTRDLQPTFASIQHDIFDAPDSAGRPACTSCHNAVGARFNGMDLSNGLAYSSLVNVASRGKPGAVRVIPGDPENSYLIHKIEGRAGIVGDRMPRFGPFLTAGQIAVIRRWIEIGAPNN